jgi:hypothetical protein
LLIKDLRGKEWPLCWQNLEAIGLTGKIFRNKDLLDHIAGFPLYGAKARCPRDSRRDAGATNCVRWILRTRTLWAVWLAGVKVIRHNREILSVENFSGGSME